jgi:hypothetical protein
MPYFSFILCKRKPKFLALCSSLLVGLLGLLDRLLGLLEKLLGLLGRLLVWDRLLDRLLGEWIRLSICLVEDLLNVDGEREREREESSYSLKSRSVEVERGERERSVEREGSRGVDREGSILGIDREGIESELIGEWDWDGSRLSLREREGWRERVGSTEKEEAEGDRAEGEWEEGEREASKSLREEGGVVLMMGKNEKSEYG